MCVLYDKSSLIMDLKFEGCGPNYMVFFVFGSLEIVFVVYLLSEVCYKMLLVCCHYFTSMVSVHKW